MEVHRYGKYVSEAEYNELKAQVERLTKAGDAMQDDLLFVVWPWNQKRFPSINAWNAAKEGKQS
jgi:phage I-like protein